MSVSKSNFYLFFLSILFLSPGISVGQAFDEDFVPLEIGAEQKGDLIYIDLDGDGDLDILHRGEELTMHVNSGDFEYENRGAIDIGMMNSFFNYDVADFNRDGLDDLLFISSLNSRVTVLFSVGDGTFTMEEINLNITSLQEAVDLTADDFDNDGDIDFVLNSSNILIEWHEQLSDGSFELVNTFSSSMVNGICLNFVDLIDINMDGNLDLAATYNDGLLIWFENNGDNTFSDFRPILNGPFGFSFFTHRFIDFDSDDDLDVVFAMEGSDEIGWAKNNNGDFDLLPFSGEPISFFGMDVGDVENDGDIDLVIGGNAGNMNQELRLYTNDGTGEVSHVVFGDEVERICRLDLVDLNNDSFDDLVVSYRENNFDFKYSIYPNLLGTPSLGGCIFFDENENQIKDDGEQNLAGYQVSLDPDRIKLQTNEEGCYTFFVDDGTYTVSHNIPSIWKLTTDSITYTVDINGNSQPNLDFGFVAEEQLLAGQMLAVSGITRCNRETRFDFLFENVGTTRITEGVIFVFPDSLVSLAEEIDQIDTIGAIGEFGWKFTDLFPGESIKRSILLNIPGLGNGIEPGTLIKIFSATEAKDTRGFVNFFKNNFESEILCAYDPNDKLVNPDREGDENFTQFKDTMIYTVRFQNTGNDTAFTVVIRDTLDQNLDVSTFNILGSSHREVLTTEILYDQFVSFSFEDILLPDSTIDFIGSQGFVSYSIEPKDGIAENTIIENTASIFFDFNPPIVTNTTQNTMVECLPITAVDVSVILEEGETYTLPDGTVVDQAGVYTTQVLDEDDCPVETTLIAVEVLTSSRDLVLNQNVSLVPNPAESYFYLDIETSTPIDYELSIFNILGEKVLRQKINTQTSRVGIQGLSSGTFLVQLTDVNKVAVAVKKLVVL